MPQGEQPRHQAAVAIVEALRVCKLEALQLPEELRASLGVYTRRGRARVRGRGRVKVRVRVRVNVRVRVRPSAFRGGHLVQVWVLP